MSYDRTSRAVLAGCKGSIAVVMAYMVAFAPIILLLLVVTGHALADEDRDVGRGMELLGAQRGRDPLIGDIYDKLKSDLKPSVRDGLGKSDWLDKQTLTTDGQLKDALTDKSVLIRGADGRITSISRAEAGRILQAGIRNAAQNPNWADIYNKVKGRVGIEKIEKWAKDKGGSLLAPLVKTVLESPWAAQKALGTDFGSSTLTTSLLTDLDKESTKVRGEIKQELACKTAKGVVNAANARLSAGDSVGAQSLLNSANTSNCPDAERARQNAQSGIDAANKDARRQAQQCAEAKTRIASARSKAANGDDAGAQADLNSTAVRNCASTQADAAQVQKEVDRIRTCKAAKSASASEIVLARSQIGSGQLASAETTLDAIDDKNCNDVRSDVNAVRTEINNETARINRQSADAMNSCDDSVVRNAATDLARYTHPRLTPAPGALNNRAAAIVRTNAAFDAANSAFKAGNLKPARDQLVQLRGDMASSGISNCPKSQRAGRGIGLIDRLTGLINQATAAARNCDMAAIDRLTQRFNGINNPVKNQVLPTLQAAAKRCNDPNTNQDCTKTFGPTSFVILTGGGGITTCGCKPPNKMNNERNRCVRPEDVAAEGNNFCRGKYGPGAEADYSKSSYKTYACVCRKGTKLNCAKNRCVPKNQLVTDLRQRATAICKRRAKGRRLTRVRVSTKTCKYTCSYAKKRIRRREPRRREPADRGGHDRAFSTMVGIGIGIGVGRSRDRRRPRGRGPRRGCRKHHKRTTSRWYCGRN